MRKQLFIQRKNIYLAGVFTLGLVFLISNRQIAGDPPPKRAHHALIYDAANKCVFMTAGSTPVNDGESYIFFNDRWCYDGKTWKANGEAGDKRSGTQLAYDSKRGKIYSYGGYSGQTALGDLRVLENGNWKKVSEIPGILAAEPGFVYDSDRDRLIVFGGSAGQGQANGDTYEWDGSNWKKFEGAGPGPRQAFAMVYDSKRKRAVINGGRGSDPKQRLTDTWEFDGKTWTKVSDTGPGWRLSPGATFDTKRNIMIIFGGVTSTGMSNDTWGWDGKEWKQLAQSGPPTRAMGYLAYDSERDRTVLFGGRYKWPDDANDTWEWDGAKWEKIESQ